MVKLQAIQQEVRIGCLVFLVPASHTQLAFQWTNSIYAMATKIKMIRD